MDQDTSVQTPVIDPMDQSCDDIDTSYPILPAANYPMVCTSAKVEDNKAKTGQNLVTKWKNRDAAKTSKGKEVAPGEVVLTSYSSLTVTENLTPSRIAKNLTIIAKACRIGKVTTPRALQQDPSVLVDKEAVVKVSLQAESADFPESNKIAGFVIPE